VLARLVEGSIDKTTRPINQADDRG
jgi:hypothetical protein